MQATNKTDTRTANERRLSKRAKPVVSKGVVPKESSLRTSFTANFSEMVLINFEADERLLKKITPRGLEPDLYQGKGHISLVAKTIRGLKYRGMLLSRDFASVGLQLYVREPVQGGYRHGTFFLKHYVQRSMAAWFMSKLTHSEVTHMPITHKKSKTPVNRPPDIEYLWKVREKWNDIRIRGRSRVKEIRQDSKIAYILKHADRYVVNDQGIWRSEMSTPGWIIWDVAQAKFDCDVERLFGSEYVKAMAKRPTSVFLSRGNKVALSKPELVVPA
jgi:hypothetical protein